jgi:O-antigen ligase
MRSVLVALALIFLASLFFSIAVNSLALALMALAWIALMAAEKRWVVQRTPLDFYFLAWVLAEIVSTVQSVNPAQSLFFSRRLLLIGIVYFFATEAVNLNFAKKSLAVMLLGAAIAAVYGVLYYFLGPENIQRLGIFQIYMTTSTLMFMSGLLLIPFVIHPGTPTKVRWWAGVALVPVLLALYATVTRGAYLAVSVGFLLIALLRNKKLVIVLLVVIVVVFILAPPYVIGRLQSIVDLHHPENLTRIAMWKTALRIFADHPWFGIGDVDVRETYLLYKDADDPAEHGHLHNVMIQLLVNLGIVGLLAVAALFVRIFVVEWKVFRKVKSSWFEGSVALGALALFTGFQVNGLVEWSFGDQEVVIMLWVSLGLSLAMGRLAESGRDGT